MGRAMGVTYADTEELKSAKREKTETRTDGSWIGPPLKTMATGPKTRNNTDAKSRRAGNRERDIRSRARECHRLTVRTVNTGHAPSRMT